MTDNVLMEKKNLKSIRLPLGIQCSGRFGIFSKPFSFEKRRMSIEVECLFFVERVNCTKASEFGMSIDDFATG